MGRSLTGQQRVFIVEPPLHCLLWLFPLAEVEHPARTFLAIALNRVEKAAVFVRFRWLLPLAFRLLATGVESSPVRMRQAPRCGVCVAAGSNATWSGGCFPAGVVAGVADSKALLAPRQIALKT